MGHRAQDNAEVYLLSYIEVLKSYIQVQNIQLVFIILVILFTCENLNVKLVSHL